MAKWVTPINSLEVVLTLLGTGLYRLSDLARYARVPVTTARSWFKARSDGRGYGPIFVADHGDMDGEFFVSFLNLIEAYAVDFFRGEGVSPREIRRAHEILMEKLKTPHPFAHANLKTDGKRIIHDVAGEVRGHLYEVVSRQRWFPQWRGRLRGVEYGTAKKLATKWAISRGVIIDPKVNFGEPVVRDTGVATWVIRNQYFANNKNADLVAKLFDIRKADVRYAVAFESSLNVTVA